MNKNGKEFRTRRVIKERRSLATGSREAQRDSPELWHDREVEEGKPCYAHDGGHICIIQGLMDFLARLFFKVVLLKDPDSAPEVRGPVSHIILTSMHGKIREKPYKTRRIDLENNTPVFCLAPGRGHTENRTAPAQRMQVLPTAVSAFAVARSEDRDLR